MDQNLDIMPENQISADYMYIEIIPLKLGLSKPALSDRCKQVHQPTLPVDELEIAPPVIEDLCQESTVSSKCTKPHILYRPSKIKKRVLMVAVFVNWQKRSGTQRTSVAWTTLSTTQVQQLHSFLSLYSAVALSANLCRYNKFLKQFILL